MAEFEQGGSYGRVEMQLGFDPMTDAVWFNQVWGHDAARGIKRHFENVLSPKW
jgi:hypothetical protein